MPYAFNLFMVFFLILRRCLGKSGMAAFKKIKNPSKACSQPSTSHSCRFCSYTCKVKFRKSLNDCDTKKSKKVFVTATIVVTTSK